MFLKGVIVMKNKILGLIMTIIAVFAIGTNAYAATYVNNEDVSNEVFTTISNDYTLFPVRYLGEKLGCDVCWNSDDKCITVSKGDIHRDFYNGSPVVYDWNGNSYSLVTAPMLVDGNTMVPAEFYRDHFGISVLWDSVTSSLFINSEDTYNWLINSEEYKQATEPQDIYGTLNPEQIRNLNVFLSNFSEAHFNYYDSNNPDADRMISFAFTHNLINNSDSIWYSNMAMGLLADRVDETLNKYFGMTVPRRGTSNWWYEGASFCTKSASGEGYATFSVSNSLYDLKNGTYGVNFNNYYVGYGNDVISDSKYYWYCDSDAYNDYDCHFSNSGFAIIKPFEYNGKNTWQLLYLETE